MSDVKSSLRMDELVFDKISFVREGFKNDNEINFSLESRIAQRQDQEVFRVTLNLKGNKKDEYSFEISLTGFFSFEDNGQITEKEKNTLVSQNTVAIMIPFLRSQVSLLTAQPGVDCVMMPIFNVNNIVNPE